MRIFTLIFAWTLVTVFSTSVLSAETRTVKSADGRQVEIPTHPARLVVLSEIDLDAALALGLKPVGAVNGRGQKQLPRYLLEGNLVSGVEVDQIPIVGDIGRPNIEALIELEPDLIMSGPLRPETLELLSQIAPTVISFERGEAWKSAFARIATILNRDAEHEQFMQRYQDATARAAQTLGEQQGNTLSIIRWNPKGPAFMRLESFASLVIQDMGLKRPEHQQEDGFAHSLPISLEALHLLDADWLLVGTLSADGQAVEAMKQAQQSPAFQQVSAVKNGKFAAVDGSLWTSLGGPLAAMAIIDDTLNIIQSEKALAAQGVE